MNGTVRVAQLHVDFNAGASPFSNRREKFPVAHARGPGRVLLGAREVALRVGNSRHRRALGGGGVGSGSSGGSRSRGGGVGGTADPPLRGEGGAAGGQGGRSGREARKKEGRREEGRERGADLR